MTQKQIKALKQQILALNWDAHRKRAKAVGLSQKLLNEAHEHARFTRADYQAFYRSRRIKP
jgi:DnaJ-domain-containing protein 1